MKTTKKAVAAKPTAKKTVAKKPMMKAGGISKPLPKKQMAGGVRTPFQNYLVNNPNSYATDTSEVFTGSRDGSNEELDKAYYDTYYAGQENKRRTGSDKVTFDLSGKRMLNALKQQKKGGGIKAKAKKVLAKVSPKMRGGGKVATVATSKLYKKK